MNSLKLQNSYNPNGGTSSNEITMNVFRIILDLIASYAFFFAAFMFVGRLVAFFILMVLSPIGFIGDLIPIMKEYSKKWWDTLFNQTLVAPVFLFFMYMLIMLGKTTSSMARVNASQIDVGLYINFAIIIGLLLAAVKVTKKLSGEVGGVMTKLGGTALGVGLGLATGGAALFGTKVIGAGAKSLMDSKFGEKLKNSGGIASRLAFRGLDKTSKASFDARNTATFKGATDFVGNQTGIKVDYNRGLKIRKDGFQGAVDRNTKRNEDYAKLVTKDMPEITNEQIEAEMTTGIDSRIAEKRAKITNANTVERAKLTKEIEDLEKRKTFDPGKLRKEMEKEQKDARLEIHAKAAENSIIGAMVGGKSANKAAAKAIRKMKGGKSADDMLREIAKQKQEEDAAAGITPPATGPAAPKAAAPAAPTPTPPPAGGTH